MINLKSIKINKSSLKKIVIVVVAAGVTSGVGYLGYEYYQTNKELSEFHSSEEALAIKQRNDLLKKVSNLTLLPENEEPTIATVTDVDKVRGQKFFSRAQNGDKVIVFTQSQRAVLYRPSIEKVIESSPININDLGASVAQGQQFDDQNAVLGESAENQKREPAKIAVFNGTLYVEGLATQVGAYLEKMFSEEDTPSITIAARKNAPRLYQETTIINLNEEYSDIAEIISQELGGKIEERDENEDIEFTEVDIVVIAGTDLNINELK